MSIKKRLGKLEEKHNPDWVEICIIRFCRSEPLPEPFISGGVQISYQYADDAEPDN